MAQQKPKKQIKVKKKNDVFYELNKEIGDDVFDELETFGFDDLSQVFEEEE